VFFSVFFISISCFQYRSADRKRIRKKTEECVHQCVVDKKSKNPRVHPVPYSVRQIFDDQRLKKLIFRNRYKFFEN
jgi:hypothetical protein